MTRQGENSPGARRAPPPPPTRAEYDAARPFHKGFMAVMFGGQVKGIPGRDLCPFDEGTRDRENYDAGARRAEIDLAEGR